VTKHGGKDPRVEPGSARYPARRDFLKISGGAMVGASCAPFSLACSDQLDSSSEAGSGGATLRGTAGLWYEDNMGRAGGMPPDFKEKFYRPDLWAGAREAIDVYYIRATTLLKPENGLDDSFLGGDFVPVLEESGVEIALDAVGANFLRACPAPTDERIEREISLVEKLGAMGGRVGYVALQSVLSKPVREEGRVVEYPMQQRIEDVVDYAKTVRERLPDVQLEIIDALPKDALDYRDPYGWLAAALAEEDLELNFVHLDGTYEPPQEGARITWEGVKEVESFVKADIGARFGFICISRTGGEASDEALNDNVLDVPRQYASVDGSPNEYVVMSWFPHPGSTIPESAGPGRFPDAKMVLSFARELGT
jgi:hypothetical protein